jgi:hypothetical protein
MGEFEFKERISTELKTPIEHIIFDDDAFNTGDCYALCYKRDGYWRVSFFDGYNDLQRSVSKLLQQCYKVLALRIVDDERTPLPRDTILNLQELLEKAKLTAIECASWPEWKREAVRVVMQNFEIQSGKSS